MAYSKEFRENAVKLCEARGWRVTEVARELGMPSQSLQNWVTKARKSGARPTTKTETVEEENQRLRREVRQLGEELEIAKKAAAFFARHQK
jgi:transposase